MVYKACGKIIYDTETKSIKALHVPVILDLVQDQVRNRWYSLSITCAIVTFVAFWTFGPIFRDPSSFNNQAPVALMSLLVIPAGSLAYGQQMVPFPVIQVVDAENIPLWGKKVQVVARPSSSDYSNFPDVFNPYQATLSGDTIVNTNAQGLAVFMNLAFSAGMQMSYDLFFYCGDQQVSTTVYVTSTLQDFTVKAIPTGGGIVAVGQRLNSYQFVACATNSSGLAAQGVIINTFVNPLPEYGIVSPRYGILEYSSNVTGDDGCVTFDELTVSATTTLQLSFSFVCQGSFITKSFGELGVQLYTQVMKISVDYDVNQYSTEGIPMYDFGVFVYGPNNVPLAKKTVFAVISTEASYLNTQFNSIFQPKKSIQNMISKLSDKNGRADFNFLSFDTSGMTGPYRISFICDGVTAFPFYSFVGSNVESILLDYPPVIDLSGNDMWLFTRVFGYITVPSNKILKLMLSYPDANVTIALNVTDSTGTTMWNPRQVIPRTPVVGWLMVDNIVSSSFEFINLPPRRSGCVFIEVLTNFDHAYYLGDPTGVQPKVRAVDAYGNGVANMVIKAATSGTEYDFMYFTNAETLQYYAFSGSATTDADGFATFTSFKIVAGYSGSTPVVFVDEQSTCASNYSIVTLVSSITSVLFEPVQSGGDMSTIIPFSNVPFMVQVTINSELGLAATIYPTIYIVGSPSYAQPLSSTIFNGTGSISTNNRISLLNSYTSDIPCIANLYGVFNCSMGNMYALGYYGNYTIIAEVAGIQSFPLSISIPQPVSSISMIPANVTSQTANLQQLLPIQPQVKVLDRNGNGVSGAIIQAYVCNNPNVFLLNTLLSPFPTSIPSANSNFAISYPSDNNGVAVFDGLLFYSAPSGVYSLCFQVTDGTSPVSVKWPVQTTINSGQIQISITANSNVVVPNTPWSLQVSYSSSISFTSIPIYVSSSSSIIAGPTGWIINNTDSKITLDNIMSDDDNKEGLYQVTLNACGFTSNSVSVGFLKKPGYISIQNYSDEPITVNIMQVLTVPVKVLTISNFPLSNIPVTAYIESFPDNSSSASLYPPVVSSVSDENGVASVKFMFSQGTPGVYCVRFECDHISTSLNITLVNPVYNVTLLATNVLNKLMTFEYNSQSFGVLVLVTDINGKPIPNRILTAQFVGILGNSLKLYGNLISDSKGIVTINSMVSLIFVPGKYQIVFSVDGINSLPWTVTVTNTLFPDFNNFNIHDAQWTTFLVCLLTIPLFIGNSTRQPSWQLVLSLVAMILLNVILNSFAKRYILETSAMFLVLQEFTKFSFYLAAACYLVVVYIAIAVFLRKKDKLNFFQYKRRSCEDYVRHLLFKRPSKILVNEPDESIIQKFRWVTRTIYRGIRRNFKPDPPNEISNAFFFPQRMLIGFGVSFCCLFITALGSVLVYSWPIYFLGLAHDNLNPYLTLFTQIKVYLNTQANGMDTDQYIELIINEITALNVIPFGAPFLLQVINVDVPKLALYIQKLDDFVVNMRRALINSAYAAIVVVFFIVLFFRVIVFAKYKRRIILLRQGKYKDVFYQPKDYAIASSAYYIGLSAIHTAVGYFLLCAVVIVIACILQYRPLYAFALSYLPVLLTFLVGFPFISKMLTKFVVAKYIVQRTYIRHFRLWVIFDFMWIFVNLLSVLALTVLRFIVGIFASLIIFTRMDEPILHSSYASYDYGFSAYAGTLLMDHFHNNPILLVFVEHFIEDMKEQRKRRKENFLQSIKKGESSPLLAINEEDASAIELMAVQRKAKLQRNRIITKWWLLYVLSKNEQLRDLRSRGPSFIASE